MTLKSIVCVGTLLLGLSPAWAFSIKLHNGQGELLMVRVADVTDGVEREIFKDLLDPGVKVEVKMADPDMTSGNIHWEAMTAEKHDKCGSGSEFVMPDGDEINIRTRDSCSN